ncbi:LPS assembly lipoprotein LptE [Mesorhizobium sp. LHD-90]|uniref:LPS assembly lipoprotein LptE n=1 Tax=Mesorhizobium sp. LHD-90 TaxID=3071414 RepID=UPI0027DF84A6|nr:LPS assembly lipoprotein LptE [Mesorhizobium sp. LHD-90]MDQ6437259.1 LPS assembly lipoprotein LptE [Mesorhizobium sp. LHD-90]
MSLPDRLLAVGPFRSAGILALCAALVLASACTVRPLYSDAGIQTGAVPGAAEGLKQISIDAVDTRYAQELRNQLIFLFNGGAGQPAQAKYKMTLTAAVQVVDEAVIEIDNDNRPTAATLHMTGSYVLIDLATGNPVAKGTRTIPASYDQPTQEFANLRARRDAENRAARELAELLRLDVAQKLVKLQAA